MKTIARPAHFIFFLIILFAVPFLFANVNICFALKNPFISPFKVKQYKNLRRNPLIGINLQAIVSSDSDPNKNVAIINNKPYYKGSDVMGETVVDITPKAVFFKSQNGRIVKLILSKYEGFKK